MLRASLVVIAVSLAAAPAAAQTPQTPWKGQNLQIFPKDIPRDQLVQRMREFSFALGIRCQHCHSGGDGVSFEGVDFASDDKPAKVKARAMLRMVDQLNNTILAQVPSRATPRVEVGCVTCHRGLPLPKTLQTILFEIVERDGAAAAVERYRQLRRDQMVSGRYNFGEWEINELARRLTEASNTEAAIAILEMNGEFHPKSADIDFGLGELHRRRGEREKAIARYEAALAKQPNFPAAIQRLKELRGK